MDILSIIGVLIGFSAIIAGNSLGGGDFDFLLNVHALIIVLGGTLGATLLHFPPRVVWQSVKISRWVVSPQKFLCAGKLLK
nr:hypothetical protein [Methylomarinum sp. Ch1-1]MDP4519377.1 hypothetical protein [Methylomarinum sp. Ch1-1]